MKDESSESQDMVTYGKPELRKLGKIEDMTQGFATPGADGFGSGS